MPPSSARRAGASLLGLLSSPQCRVKSPRYFTHLDHPTRSLSTTSRRWQSMTPSAAEAAANTRKVSNELSAADESQPLRSLTDGLDDPSPIIDEDEKQVDWARSFHGLSSTPFTPEQAAILQQEVPVDDIEVKPDGIVYLPEIKYRRILNRAFGPGGWGLAPRGETIVTSKIVTREYGLIAGGRLISIARGEMQYFDPDGIPTATEGCKSNALMRCCKDLGIASELWDPRYIKRFHKEYTREVMVEHAVTKKRRKHFMRKDDEVRYPFKEVGAVGGGQTSTQTPTQTSSSTQGAASRTPQKAAPVVKAAPKVAVPSKTPLKTTDAAS